MKEILIVDGYNIIGDWPELVELKRESLELARDHLVGTLKEYQRFTGMEVIIVFDAHMATGERKEYKQGKLQVLFSKTDETADDVIERLVYQLETKVTRVYVATSDYAEQQVTFGEGALRISANELRKMTEQARKAIDKEVQRLSPTRNRLEDQLNKKVVEIFEKWRRKNID
ncbi:NYN domain-containing protein [Effusibacillus dendaii]|uniref:NYN domain-containing protein n=1 Tax=Effusibacillus dendaii TaxID=2743772 RepID=A0A7I8DBJ1_9BACL|nr:NYN domain-containing protein [Effusibacillus dendaii]BCJ87357.1 hypothetical protein skT53_23420 [Effusibacillus dendaii]